jgi:hypothetical protein
LLECKPLLILVAVLCLFHLGNAAMLPLYGMAVVSDDHAKRKSRSFICRTRLRGARAKTFSLLAVKTF